MRLKLLQLLQSKGFLTKNICTKGKKNCLPIRLCVKSRVRTDLSKSMISSGKVCFSRKMKESKVSMFPHEKHKQKLQAHTNTGYLRPRVLDFLKVQI